MAKSRDAKANKAARAEAKATRKAAAKERRSQLWQAFNIQRQEDKRLLPYMIGAFVLIVAIAVAIGVWSGEFALISMPALGVVLGALVAFGVKERGRANHHDRDREVAVRLPHPDLGEIQTHRRRIPHPLRSPVPVAAR